MLRKTALRGSLVRLSCRSMTDDRGHSLVAALREAEQSRRHLLVGSAIAAAAYVAYNECARAYGYMILGSAATEQLYMQRLDGTVELELRLRSFSSVGELRGQLTPVSSAPRTKGAMNHRAFTLLQTAGTDSGISSRTKARHEAMRSTELPPIATLRHVDVIRPWHLSALVFGPSELHLYCRKTRSKTEYFSVLGDSGRIFASSGLE